MGAVGDGAGDELELLAGVALVVDLPVARLKLRFLDDGSAFTVRDRNVDCRIVSKRGSVDDTPVSSKVVAEPNSVLCSPFMTK